MRIDRGTLRALAIASQLGFTVAAAIGLGVLGGLWVDDRLGTRPIFLLVGIVFGLLSAAYAVLDLMNYRRGAGEDEDRNHRSP